MVKTICAVCLSLQYCIAFDSEKFEAKQYVPGLPVAIQSTAAQNLNTTQTSENQSITSSNTIVGNPLSLNGTGTGDTVLGNTTGSLTILAGGGLTIDIGALSFANVSAGSGVPLVLGPGNTVYYMPSSMRYKKDISYITQEYYDKLLSLKPVTYKYENEDASRIGFIAEEVEKIIPECVLYDENGLVQGVDYASMNALIIGHLIESHDENIVLKEKLAQLEASIMVLMSEICNLKKSLEK